jgi:Domain of unknown function (DUF4381)
MEPSSSDSLIDLLDQIADITEPPPVSMWPATWAWAVLALVVLAALALGLWAILRHRRATAWRRAALAELGALAPDLEAGDPAALAALETLLRRVALVTAPRATVAPLTADGWTRFLADTGARFGDLAGELATAPYRPAPRFDGPAALAAARAWIRHRHA